MSISQALNNLQPRTRRIVLTVGAITAVVGVSALLTSMTERKASRVPRANKPEVTVVSPQRATGVEQFGARFEGMEKSFRELSTAFERRLASLEESKKSKADGGVSEDGQSIRLTDPVPPLAANTSVFDAPPSRAPSLPPPPTIAPQSLPATPSPLSMPMNTQMPSAPTAPEPVRQEATSMPSIRILSESGQMDDSAAEQKLNKAVNKPTKKREAETAFIPGGSMFPAVLLNGMDAPTSSVSQKNPTPVLLRVKKEAVLPNFASLDVRECFVMGAGFGQLASERALIRTESISCVRHDGKVFDTKLEAYVVGTDGKVGVPGRLVSKQGQMIAQSLLAGALGGIGQSLTSSKIPALNINPTNGQSLYDQESMGSIAQSGFAGGLSSATNMIAKFYLDMAKETFPVVETQAGQVATVIVTRGMTLPLKGSTSLEQYVEPGKTRVGSANNTGDGEDAPRPVSTSTGSAAPAPVVGQHQVPVTVPGLTAATPKSNNKLQW